MAVRIRLNRKGRIHKPFYRVVAVDVRVKRDGKSSEVLGTYDPLIADKNLQVDVEKVHAWIRQGATYSDGVASLMKHAGYELYPADVLEAREKQKAKTKAKRLARKKTDKTDKGTFVAPTRRARLKHEAKLKAVRLAKAKEEADAKAAAEAEAAAKAEAEAAAGAEAEAPAEESSES